MEILRSKGSDYVNVMLGRISVGKKHCETFFLFLIQAPQQRANKQLVLSDHARQAGDLIPVPEGGYTHPVAPRPQQEGCG